MQGIKVQFAEIGINMVSTLSARAVHKATGGYASTFGAWADYRIKKYGMKEGVDYTSSLEFGRYGRKDYAVTLHAAIKMAASGRGELGPKVAAYIESLLPPGEIIEAATQIARVAVFAAPAHLDNVKTMSSVEIVEVINSLRGPDKAELRHNNFMAKIESHPGIAALNFKHYYLGANGKQEPCYYLPKREAELMVMSESLEVQTQVYDRLAELESAVIPKLPQTYAQALMELALTVQKTEALQIENAAKATQIEQQTLLIETQKPSVEFVEKYVEADGALNFRTVAKLLGAKEADFRNFLYDNKIRHRQGTKWTHHTRYGEGLGNAGYFKLKTGVTTGGVAYSYSYFTPKGVEWITRKWNERKPVLTRKASPVQVTREMIES